MNQPYLTKQKLIAALLLITAFVIYSCRKDASNNNEQTHDNAIAQARAWYQQTYPVKISTGNLKNMNMSTLAESTKGDFSQLIKPDWNQADTYQRLGKEVIEMPLDSAVKLGFAPETAGEYNFNKAYSHSSFLILKDTKGYQAYIMTIMADTAWVGNDFKKLNNLNYRNRGNAFSGKLLYFTPKGKLTSGYTYKNGKVTGSITGSPVTNPLQKQQAKTANGKKTAETSCTSATVRVYVGMACVQDTQTEIIYCVKFYDIYRMTTCYEMSDQPLGTGDSGWIPPSSGGTTTEEVIDQEEEIEVQDIKDHLIDTCNKKALIKLTNAGLQGSIATIIHNTFGTSDKVNLEFYEFNDSHAAPAKSDEPTVDHGVWNMKIYVNQYHFLGSAQEYKTVIMVHEILHGYMNYNNQNYMNQVRQHQEIAEKYVESMKVFVQNLYPISNEHAYALILNGLSDMFGNNKPAYLETLKTKYNVSNPFLIYECYRQGILNYGTPCSL